MWPLWLKILVTFILLLNLLVYYFLGVKVERKVKPIPGANLTNRNVNLIFLVIGDILFILLMFIIWL